jgi:hypothetical protein
MLLVQPHPPNRAYVRLKCDLTGEFHEWLMTRETLAELAQQIERACGVLDDHRPTKKRRRET